MTPGGPPLKRRALLVGGAAVLAGGGAALGAGLAARDDPVAAAPASFGAETVPFHGDHQPGIETHPVQAHAAFVALDLRPGSGTADVRRLLRLLTDDAERLMAGRVPLGAADPELPARPARLTVTVGFGPGLFDAIGRPDQCPPIIRQLPEFRTDRLDPRWCGGDLLLQVCSDDAVPLSYALRRLVRDARSVTTVRWTQRGFNPARGAEPEGTTPRNLMGQRDGSANPVPGTPEFEQAVWVREGPDWLVGGSMLVLRRIRMELETWDDFGRAGKEMVVARTLDTGAPVTGGLETDDVDPRMVDGRGIPIAAARSHVLQATARTEGEKMFRRGYSFDDGPTTDGLPDAGLLFAAYQADIATAFVPVQTRLAESDLLNEWITHIGSATFAVPRGARPGEFIGQGLLGT
ncbi:dye decolorizing peroxidase [Pseudonocardia thermophila]|uniref:Dye decolorizing peroxidase n=1 Tax=Pseudonocardia thermophila TaxID=1848 RepID=A0A1M6YRZ1_PSETH|nr:Dyp-type peroxidase [Pseudonocardia thermophila]SHL21018.1 dye decolorizing peroxidase [Pseudonocardia thermophila]